MTILYNIHHYKVQLRQESNRKASFQKGKSDTFKVGSIIGCIIHYLY